VNIIEGERPFVINDKVFGTLELADLPGKPAGELIIEVSFELDSNIVLRVTATELQSGKWEAFQAHSGLYSRYDGVDLDAVMMDAEEHVEEDFRKRAVADEELILENESEFGIVVVPREGEKPTRWYWNEEEGMGYKL
jgi:molecular chaperone DnaK (HSP70)